MISTRVPGVLRRGWAWVVMSPWRLALFVEPWLGVADDEDAFSAGEGGKWVWYPGAGSLQPQPQSAWWRFAGAGASVVGSLTRGDDSVRFVPSGYWKRRGVHAWTRRVTAEDERGKWLVIDTADGDAVLRRR